MKTVEGFTLRPLGKEFILTSENVRQVNFNRMISLNESAAFLWRSVDGKEFSIDDLVGLLVERYGIDAEMARHDSEAIVVKWREAGIITD